MLQLSPNDVFKEQEQRLLDPSAGKLLVGDEAPKAGAADIVPNLNKLHIIVRVRALLRKAVVFILETTVFVFCFLAVVNRAHPVGDIGRIYSSTKEDPLHISTKKSLTLLCDGSRRPLCGAGSWRVCPGVNTRAGLAFCAAL